MNSHLTWFSNLEMAARDSLDDMPNVKGLQSQCDAKNLNRAGVSMNGIKAADDGGGYGWVRVWWQ